MDLRPILHKKAIIYSVNIASDNPEKILRDFGV
jgi:hypothetical protein